jgi:hypothetical protein
VRTGFEIGKRRKLGDEKGVLRIDCAARDLLELESATFLGSNLVISSAVGEHEHRAPFWTILKCCAMFNIRYYLRKDENAI